MSYDIGDGYYVDDNGDIQKSATDTTGYQTSGYDTATGGDTSSNFNLSDIGKLLKGTSDYGMAGQLVGLGGIGALLNKILGKSANGGYAGYQGSIPKYTASRQQYAVPTTGVASTYKPTDTEIRDYALRPGINDAMVARGMNQFGISPERMAGIMQLPTQDVQARYQAAMGPNMVARRPGSGGVTYFSPIQYTQGTPAVTPAPTVTPSTDLSVTPAAGGGLMHGGIANLGSYSDGGQLLRGPGDGVSDSIPATIGGHQPARLADGEFVVPARIVSELGNGSTEAGARKLYAMMDRIKATRAKASNIAANTKADKHLPV